MPTVTSLDRCKPGPAPARSTRLPRAVEGELVRRVIANGTTPSYELRQAVIRGLGMEDVMGD